MNETLEELQRLQEYAAMKDAEDDFYNDVDKTERFKHPASLYEAILIG